MILFNSAADRPVQTRITGLVLTAMGLGLLAGCSAATSPGAGTPAAPVVAVEPMTPLVAFAATAQPGAETTLALPGSGPARVRVLRTYNAASGRECREVLVGAGTGEQARLVCGADGQWAEARPLLRGGGLQRP
ncbi:DVU3141 family protein [Belnapia moabensis]|uniref:DVU3141 family protein n=1 Tax=Belnapia moabensis TaxID=365533 RepID=UPI0005BCBFD1|nr:DVU3141 family protein [Belnapia moabensis]